MELILARPETSAIRGEQGDWISSSCLNTYRLVESRRPRTRSESQHAEGGIFDSSEVTEPVQQEVEGELWMSSSRLNKDQPAKSRKPCMRSKSRRVEGGIFDSSEVAEQIQQEVEGELRALPDLTPDSSSDKEKFDQRYLVEFSEEDMSGS